MHTIRTALGSFFNANRSWQIKQEDLILFEIVNNNVTFSPQALMLKPFKAIWDADKSKDKETAVAELALIYYMKDDRSDFMYIMNENERLIEARLRINMPKSWKPNKAFKEAMAFYVKMSETIYTQMLLSSRAIINKIREFNDTVNLKEKDDKGKYIHNTKHILGSIKEVLTALESLDKIEELIVKQKELKAQSGNAAVGLYEDDGI